MPPDIELHSSQIIVELNQTVIELEIQPQILGVTIGSGVNKFNISVTQSMLSGSLYVFAHPLDTLDVDLTITDLIGEVGIEWKPLNTSFIRLNFQGLTPLTDTYKVTVRK